jgi:hypothetical protein
MVSALLLISLLLMGILSLVVPIQEDNGSRT